MQGPVTSYVLGLHEGTGRGGGAVGGPGFGSGFPDRWDVKCERERALWIRDPVPFIPHVGWGPGGTSPHPASSDAQGELKYHSSLLSLVHLGSSLLSTALQEADMPAVARSLSLL